MLSVDLKAVKLGESKQAGSWVSVCQAYVIEFDPYNIVR